VTSASAAAITRATEMIVPWAVERTSVVKDSWDRIPAGRVLVEHDAEFVGPGRRHRTLPTTT